MSVYGRSSGFGGGWFGGVGGGLEQRFGGFQGPRLYTIEPRGVVGTGSETRRKVPADGRVSG